MNEKLKTARGWFFDIVVTAAVVALVPMALSTMLHTPHPLAAITSSSMWPVLKRGDLVFIKGGRTAELQPGAIVVFRDAKQEAMIIHRIVRWEGDTIVTKGDANDTEDEPIKASSVVGVVPMIGKSPAKLPYLGHVALALKPEEQQPEVLSY